MSLKYKIDGRVEVAPGIVNYDLNVSANKGPASKPKIDKAFAKLFASKLKEEARQVRRSAD